MKLLVQSVLFSIAVHVIYFVTNVSYGWYITKQYVPTIGYSDVTYLQNEVAFGYVVQPGYYFFSFIVTAIFGAIGIILVKKIRISRKGI